MVNLSQPIASKTINFNALIMAGGTGGHIFPGLAVARELQSKGWKANWLGSVGGMESQLIGQTDIPLNLISISGLRGNGLIGWLKAPFVLITAVFQALKIMRKVKPDLVIGFGGFASGPGGLAAYLLRKPLFIHEQNAVAGMTNKILAKLSKRVFQAFPDALKKHKNCETIGNPIRKEITELNKIDKIANNQTKINLLVIGGSRGAKVFNEVLPGILSPLIKLQKIDVRHQSGRGNLKQTLSVYAENQITKVDSLKVDDFINNMSDAYLWADLVVCRAGALTVSEIAAVGIAAVFVPFPFAVDDHQTKNALWLVEQDAAILINEADLALEQSRDNILSLVEDSERLNRMAKKAKKLAYLDATQVLAEACELLMEEVA
jgi:UDP-N-acetylglucosamine--N-acetylmuramyl-(pentapeptide) pyrophosphoryl-undecaprenol N-acetylglucosamine transferase